MVESSRLLIVDDDPDIGALIEQVAGGVGFRTLFLERSDQMLETYRSFLPTLIILDLMMPDMDGVQVLRSLAGESCEADIILFSGADSRVLNTAARLGESHGLRIRELLHKPVTVEELEAVFRRFTQTSTEDLEAALRAAISSGDIDVHYQPKVDLSATSEWRVRGIEALARWTHPTRGPISPNMFIPLAEQVGLIDQLTDAVFDTAVQQTRALQENGYALDMALNLSPLVLSDPSVPDRLARRLAQSGIDNERIIIEITEGAAMAEGAQAMESLTRFRLKGMRLSLDDFGTGYSSLVQLYRMPFSELKVDRSFVRELKASEEARVIVRSIVDLAHNLGLAVCAEGIETPATLGILRSLGCDQGQGFLVSRPLPAADLMRFLATHAPSRDARVASLAVRR